LKRFEHIFDQSEGGLKPGRQKPAIPVNTLPGNHDLGYEAVQASIPEVLISLLIKFFILWRSRFM
jgi:hypothetical protein